MINKDLKGLIGQALERRGALMERLRAEGTDCYRIFHGIAEGLTGLTIDRYGPLVLAQTFREALEPAEAGGLEEALRGVLPEPFHFAYNHRGKKHTEPFDKWHRPSPEALEELACLEGGVKFLVRARHRGIDPWLFLDLRAGRRFLRDSCKGLSVLNLFAYTCGAGVTAAAGGAAETWNIDFASSSLEVGRRNAELNGLSLEKFRLINEDCMTAVRQLAGLPPGGRYGHRRNYTRFGRRVFDVVFLDPPAWAKGSLGAVDVVRDYQALFKPALLAARPGGRVIATNHVASVNYDEWTETLRRCAFKAGYPLKGVERIAVDDDFPSFDGRPPLKVAVCDV